jgi:hypothetical protein
MAWTEKYVDLADGGAGDGSSGDPWASYGEAIAELGALAGPTKIYVRGNGTLGGALAFSNDGTAVNPIWWIGCTGSGATWTPIGNDASATKPTLTQDTYQVTVTGDYQIFDGLVFTGAVTTAGGLVYNTTAGAVCTFVRCRFTTTAAAYSLDISGSSSVAIACFCSCPATAAINVFVGANGASVIGCHVTGGDRGIYLGGIGLIAFNVIENIDSGDCIYIEATSFVVANTCCGAGRDGIRVVATYSPTLLNNLIHSATGSPINSHTTDNAGIRAAFNLWYNCGVATMDGTPENMDIYNTGLATADPLPNLTEPANDAADFDLAVSQQRLAFPGVFEAGAYAFTGRMSHGAVQPLPDFPTTANTLKEDTTDGVTGTYYEPNLDTDPGVEDTDAVITGAHYGPANATQGTHVVFGEACGSLTLAKETGANARGGSGTCAKLTPTSAVTYGYWDFVVPVTAAEFTLSFYYKSFHTTSAWNGTLKVSMWDSDNHLEDPPPLLNAVDVAGTYDATYRLWTSAAKTAAAAGLCRVRIEIINGADSGGVYLDDLAVTPT